MIPDVYKKLGVRPVIHGSGTTTRYGGSRLRPEALESMRQASTVLVNIDELNEAAGAAIARMLGAEAAFVTAGASSGLILQAAACIAGDDPAAKDYGQVSHIALAGLVMLLIVVITRCFRGFVSQIAVSPSTSPVAGSATSLMNSVAKTTRSAGK